jgi:hypothetical protein
MNEGFLLFILYIYTISHPERIYLIKLMEEKNELKMFREQSEKFN